MTERLACAILAASFLALVVPGAARAGEVKLPGPVKSITKTPVSHPSGDNDWEVGEEMCLKPA